MQMQAIYVHAGYTALGIGSGRVKSLAGWACGSDTAVEGSKVEDRGRSFSSSSSSSIGGSKSSSS
jgi:hypothetical protein